MHYDAYKLGRRVDAGNPRPPEVWDGLVYPNARCWVYGEQEQEKLIPKINEPVVIQGRGIRDSIRTSIIEDFYIHEDYENSKDKIVLKPDNAHLLGDTVFNPGDILLITVNSLYLLKAKG